MIPQKVAIGHFSARMGKVPRVSAMLMIDTGAAKTAIDNQLVTQLGLPSVRYDQVVGISQQPLECPVYYVDLEMRVTMDKRTASYSFSTQVVGVPPPQNGVPYNGFIGRDFLSQWRLTYDGPRGVVAMQIDQ